MKKLLRNIIIVLLTLCILPLGLLTYEMQLPKFYGETYYAELSDMWSRLKNTEGQKLVIIGGSNVAFGIDVEQLEEEVSGYTVCPMGLYAAIGISPMLELTQPYISEGDIVVLSIEPNADSFSTYFGANAYWKCAEDDKDMLTVLSRDQKAAMLGAYYKYLQERILLAQSGESLSTGDVYAKSSFDENCSMTYLREGNAMALGFDTATPVDFREAILTDDFAEEINAFTKKVRQAGGEVYLSFCPVNRDGLAQGDEGLDDFYDMLDQGLDCEIISNPRDYVMDACWFYDNNVHLNTYGARVRTHMLACDLNAQLGIYREAEFEPPARPLSIYQAEETKGEDDTDDFLFERLQGGYRIVGLTEEGKKEKKLTLPSYYDGKVVVGFTAEVFSGNSVIESITIPETVESLADESFADTPHLQRIVLLHSDSTPTVGEHLLDGNTQVKIYVPVASYGMYRDGTGCAENTWANYLDRIERY